MEFLELTTKEVLKKSTLLPEKVAKDIAEKILLEYDFEDEEELIDFIDEYIFIYDDTSLALEAESETFTDKYDVLNAFNFYVEEKDIDNLISHVFLERRDYHHFGEDTWLYIQE